MITTKIEIQNRTVLKAMDTIRQYCAEKKCEDCVIPDGCGYCMFRDGCQIPSFWKIKPYGKGKKSKMRKLIKKLIIWYIFRYEDGMFEIKRKGGADQVCKIFSRQSYEKIVKPALGYGGIFYTQDQLNRAVRETIKAVRNCGENTDCEGCYLCIGKGGCMINRLEEVQEGKGRC